MTSPPSLERWRHAEELWAARQAEAARREYDALLSDPDWMLPANLRLGAIALETGQVRAAVSHALAAFYAREPDPPLLEALCRLLLNVGEVRSALHCVDDASVAACSDAKLLTGFGRMMAAHGFFDRAAGLLRRARTLGLDTAELRFALGNAESHAGNTAAAEAELGALFHNCKDAEMLRSVLIAMGHPQPATPVQTDNACASGIANDTVKQKRSRAMDMRFYWVRDRVRQDHFYIFWAPGDINIADYYTKHFAPSHHRVIRSTVLHSPSAHSAMQGCVDLRQRQPHCLAHDPLGIITSMLQPGSTLVVPSLISPLPTISPIV